MALPTWIRLLRLALRHRLDTACMHFFAMTAAQVNGDMDAVMSYMHEFYFESAAMILALITVGKCLKRTQRAKQQTL